MAKKIKHHFGHSQRYQQVTSLKICFDWIWPKLFKHQMSKKFHICKWISFAISTCVIVEKNAFSESVLIGLAISKWQKVFQIKYQMSIFFTFSNGYLSIMWWIWADISQAERAELKGSRVEWSQPGAFQFSSWNQADNMYTNKQQILVPNKNCNQIS